MTSNTPDDRTVIVPSGSFTATQGQSPVNANSSNANALSPGSRLGEFELLSVIGVGGFGIVYHAMDHQLGREVALKEYLPSALASRDGQSQVLPRSEDCRETFEIGLRSFVNEGKLLAKFDQPSLAKVYRFWEANGTAYMVMPLYRGQTLANWLKGLNAAPAEADLLAMLAPLTDALGVMHAENCFHRDIAPDNIMLLGAGRQPLLLDFGAARHVIAELTPAPTAIVKPGYAPYEQYAGLPQGAWTDVYALAATIFFCMTGKPPAPSVGRLVKDDVQPLSEMLKGRYSDRFLRALDRALALLPENRTASMLEFRNDLGLSATEVGQLVPDASRVSPTMTINAETVVDTTGSGRLSRQESASLTPVLHGDKTDRKKFVWLIPAGVMVAVIGIAIWWLSAGTVPPPMPEQPKPVPQAVLPAETNPPPKLPDAERDPTVGSFPPQQPPAIPTIPANSVAADPFSQIVTGADPGYPLIASADKRKAKLHQEISLQIEPQADGFLYLLLLGTEDTAIAILFPNTLDKNNSVKAGSRLKLPRVGRLTAEPPAGINKLIAVLSPERLKLKPGGFKLDKASGLQQIPKADAQRAITDSGLGALLSPDRCLADGARCEFRYGASVFEFETVKN
jgi:serine/threonine protein kinase